MTIPGLVLARESAAQDGGRHAAVVLQMPASARASALGGAYAAVGGDDASIFYDPAQHATVRRGVGLSVERYFASSTLAAFSAATRTGPGQGTLAVGVQSVRYESVTETVGAVETGRLLTAGDEVLSAGYGIELATRWLPGATAVRLGAAAKWVRQRVADESGDATAGDVGLAVALRGGATVAAVAQHLGGTLTLAERSHPLPRRLAVAAAWPVALSPRLALLATGELATVRDEGARVAAGAEARWRSRGAPATALTLDARLGFRQRTHGAAASPVTVGGGVGARGLVLDYAYQGYAGLGATHRLGVRWAR